MRKRRGEGVEIAWGRCSSGEMMAGEIDGFLDGRLRVFSADLNPFGSEFQLRVWHEAMKVGYGERISYGELARRVGMPGGARCVAGALGANGVLLAIPCHRVVSSDGGLGGFSAGVEMKRRLLGMEEKGNPDSDRWVVPGLVW
ncbi:MAG: methylated-DNA--[protein]-cysteine S-methyltransferase [Bacteroides sp.]|nr:methylated-DNA--[protein]-cysteine S-methyltransferase [Bacteroides sp.]